MATVNNNFRIKNGLVVEGTTATVNGLNILTTSTFGTLNTFTTTQTITPSTSVTGLIVNAAASSIGLIVKANATTPGNIQEWQNSAGTTLVNISSSGVLNTNANINLIGSGSNRTIDFGSTYGAAALYLYNNGVTSKWGWGLNAGEMQFFATNDSPTNHFSWNRGGDLQAIGTNELMRLTVGTGATSTLNLNTGSAAATGLIIKGSASQTANLQEWQNNSGTPLAKIDQSGNLTAASIIRTGGTSSQYLLADGTVGTAEIIPLDNISGEFNGIDSRFLPKYQGIAQSITNPLRLMLLINGIIQYVDFPDYVWQSPLPREGFQIDNDGYIAFSEVVPAGSSFDARIMPGIITKTRQYPFKAVDILLGG